MPFLHFSTGFDFHAAKMFRIMFRERWNFDIYKLKKLSTFFSMKTRKREKHRKNKSFLRFFIDRLF